MANIRPDALSSDDGIEAALFGGAATDGGEDYNSHVENEQISAFASAYGLKVVGPVKGEHTDSALAFGPDVDDAAFVYSALISEAVTIRQQIAAYSKLAVASGGDPASYLSAFDANTLAEAHTTLDAHGFYAVGPNSTWENLAASQKIDAGTLEALNATYLSKTGAIVAQAGDPDSDPNFGAGAVIRVPLSGAVGLPSVAAINAITAGQTMVYDLSTGRTYVLGASLDGSDAGAFKVIDDTGATLFTAPGGDVTAASMAAGLPGAQGGSLGSLSLSTLIDGVAATSTVNAASTYVTQLGDTWAKIETLSGLTLGELAQENALLANTKVFPLGTQIAFEPLTDLENANGTSTISTVNVGGLTTTSTVVYSGARGAGTPESATLNFSDGKNYATLAYNAEINLGDIRLAYDYDQNTGGFVLNSDDGVLIPSNNSVGLNFTAESKGVQTGYGTTTTTSFSTNDPAVANYFIAPTGYPTAQNGNQNLAMIPLGIFIDANTISPGQSSADLPFTINATFAEINAQGQYTAYNQSNTVDINVTGNFHNSALCDVSTGTLNFGAIHVGDREAQSVSISNVATGQEADSLLVNFSVGEASKYTMFNTSAAQTTITAGNGANLSVSVDPTRAGTFKDYISVNSVSYDSALGGEYAPTNVNAIAASVTAYNYAAADFTKSSGSPGILTGAGDAWTLDLGSVTQGGTVAPITLTLSNGAPVSNFSDLLSGVFKTGGSGFKVTGLSAFSGVAGGGSDSNAIDVGTLDTALGDHTYTITLTPTSSDSAGYSGVEAPVTLTITDDVVKTTASGSAAPPVSAGSVTASAAALLAQAAAAFDTGSVDPGSVARPGAPEYDLHVLSIGRASRFALA